MSTKRALHFVFKVADRALTTKFYRDVLGMKVLRHEEFESGCAAECNGPYDASWSKTMVGYGPEDNHFVVELTYNYGIGEYKLGNDFLGITIQSREAIENAKRLNWPMKQEGETQVLEAPGGYKFYLLNKPQPADDPVQKVSLASSNLQKSVDYWQNLCGMQVFNKSDKTAVLGYDANKCKLELKQISGAVEHAKAFGRIAFSCPSAELPGIEAAMKSKGQTILKPLVSLDTPGKATVQVVILADPDGHEICFVGDEAFRELSKVDPNGNALLDKAIADDGSNEWYAHEGMTKPSA